MARRKRQWSEHIIQCVLPTLHQRAKQPAVGRGIFTQHGGSVIQRPDYQHRRIIIQRVRQHSRGMQPFQAVLRKRQRTKEWRGQPQRVDRRTHIMENSRQGQFSRAHASANGILALQDQHRTPGARQGNCGSQSIRTRTNHHRIIRTLRRILHYFRFELIVIQTPPRGRRVTRGSGSTVLPGTRLSR